MSTLIAEQGTSLARGAAEVYRQTLAEQGTLGVIGPVYAGISSGSFSDGTHYTIFADNSILLYSPLDGVFVFDELRSYDRESLSWAAQCLARFSREQRMESFQKHAAGKEQAWISGVLWSSDGMLLDIQ